MNRKHIKIGTKISHLLLSIISNFLLEHVVFLLKYIFFAYGGIWVHTDAWRMHMNAYGSIRMHMDAPSTRY